MATTYRIRLSGYVDWDGDTLPETHEEILAALWDMELTIGDIDGLALTCSPLTPEEQAVEERRIELLAQKAREFGDRIFQEHQAKRASMTPEERAEENARYAKAEEHTQYIKDRIQIRKG